MFRLACAVAFALLPICAAAGEVQIFPSGDTLPANHLKFYLHFPERMREGVFLNYCRLLDHRGQPVLEPFRETELWSADRRRLTLWLHPGRQKTGVNLNDEFGLVLDPDRDYTLVISGQWPTERGLALGADARKSIHTIGRATRQLDPAGWRLCAPAADSRAPLQISLPAPFDHALLLRCFRVLDPAGKVVVGQSQTREAERVWEFTPATPWISGDYRIHVESVLEDLAGNSLARPFERDLEAPPPKPVPPILEIPFRTVPATQTP